MFTGLVEELGRVKRIVKGSKSIRISIEAVAVLKDAKIGDSIAVNNKEANNNAMIAKITAGVEIMRYIIKKAQLLLTA